MESNPRSSAACASEPSAPASAAGRLSAAYSRWQACSAPDQHTWPSLTNERVDSCSGNALPTWQPPRRGAYPTWCRSASKSSTTPCTSPSTRSRNAAIHASSGESKTSSTIRALRSRLTCTTKTGRGSGSCCCTPAVGSSSPWSRTRARRAGATLEVRAVCRDGARGASDHRRRHRTRDGLGQARARPMKSMGDYAELVKPLVLIVRDGWGVRDEDAEAAPSGTATRSSWRSCPS